MKDHSVVVDRSQTPTKFTFADTFNNAVAFIDRHLEEGRADKLVMRTVHEDVTFGELAERVNRCGNAMLSLGIRPGERVLIVVGDSPMFYYLVWGAVKAGIIPVVLNTLLKADDYRYIIEDSGCTALVYSIDFAVEPVAGAEAAGAPRHVLPATGPGSMTELMAGASASLDPAATAPDDPCLWLYSSGSTGRPKGVVHMHKDSVLISQYFGIETLHIGPDDVIFSAPKLFFSYGFGNAMCFPLWIGCTAILSDLVPSPDMTFDIIERFRPTVYFGVPTLYARQLAALEKRKADLSSIRFGVSAGEPLPGELVRAFRERTGIVILDGIGSTEVHHIFIANRLDDYKLGTTGRPVTGYQVKLLDPQGEPVQPGEQGRLWVRGESVARYYWNNPEKTAQTMQDGWLDTGDVFRQDDEGYFICCGRADDMLKVGGIWCSPAEIEAQLVAHPKVLEAAVVGQADADGMIKPAAYVVLKDGGDPEEALAEVLQTHCKEGLARYKYPRWVNFVDELPKTATGKIQRYKLRRLPEALPLPQAGGTLSWAAEAAGAAAPAAPASGQRAAPRRRRKAAGKGQGRKDA